MTQLLFRDLGKSILGNQTTQQSPLRWKMVEGHNKMTILDEEGFYIENLIGDAITTLTLAEESLHEEEITISNAKVEPECQIWTEKLGRITAIFWFSSRRLPCFQYSEFENRSRQN